MKTVILIITLVLFVCSCKPNKSDLEYINNNSWEYEKGYRAGDADFIHLGQVPKYWDLHHDTTFYKLKPDAVISRFIKKYDYLKIRSIKPGETGEYHNMNHCKE